MKKTVLLGYLPIWIAIAILFVLSWRANALIAEQTAVSEQIIGAVQQMRDDRLVPLPPITFPTDGRFSPKNYTDSMRSVKTLEQKEAEAKRK